MFQLLSGVNCVGGVEIFASVAELLLALLALGSFFGCGRGCRALELFFRT